MEAEKIVINLPEGEQPKELVIRQETIKREGSAVKLLDEKPPVKIDIKGTIGAPYEFLSHRYNQLSSTGMQLDLSRCHVLVNRENTTITLITNENDGYHSGTITGKLEEHPKFKEFGINNTYVWTPSELGLFFKMNRSFFPDKNENMRLINELMNFTATVNNSIQRNVSESGSKIDNFESVVNSNLPKSFTLKIPIFKGMPAETLEVETFAKVSGREIAFILFSPDAKATEEEIRDKIIDQEIAKITEICPVIPIIEQ